MDNKTIDDDDEENNKQLHSSSSSPSPNHEFSFTISLHSVSPNTTNRASSVLLPQPSMAIDLSPADDIFFHGHLLPLHLLSHLPPISPRSSTNSIQSFSTDLTDPKQSIHGQTKDPTRESNHKPSKSFSLFGLAKWRKGFEDVKETKQKRKKLGFDDVSHVIKRMVRPLLFFRRRNREFHRPYSFSGDLSGWSGRRRREEEMFSSAPASMRTSPTNSGLLVAASSGNNDSTMEELQAAIQAAIAHCKNSRQAQMM